MYEQIELPKSIACIVGGHCDSKTYSAFKCYIITPIQTNKTFERSSNYSNATLYYGLKVITKCEPLACTQYQWGQHDSGGFTKEQSYQRWTLH